LNTEVHPIFVFCFTFPMQIFPPMPLLSGRVGLLIMPLLAKRNTEHGSGLGEWRWVVERTFAWLNQFRRLRVRYEKRADIHEAFLSLGCALICWHFLRTDWIRMN